MLRVQGRIAALCQASNCLFYSRVVLSIVLLGLPSGQLAVNPRGCCWWCLSDSYVTSPIAEFIHLLHLPFCGLIPSLCPLPLLVNFLCSKAIRLYKLMGLNVKEWGGTIYLGNNLVLQHKHTSSAGRSLRERGSGCEFKPPPSKYLRCLPNHRFKKSAEQAQFGRRR